MTKTKAKEKKEKPKEYAIKKVEDFLKIPDEKMTECIADFISWLQFRRQLESMKGLPGIIAVKIKKPGFTWIDDSKREGKLRISVETINEEAEKDYEAKDAVFYFNFILNEFDEPERAKGFVIRAAGMEKAIASTYSKNFVDFTQEKLRIKYANDFETKYGVHEWTTNPDSVNGSKINAIGYNSYQVKKNQIDDLMKEWHNIFIMLAGKENVTNVVPVSIPDKITDYEIYQEVLSLAPLPNIGE